MWVDVLENANDWPGLGKSPERPLEFPNEAAEQEWRSARDAYVLARNSDLKYRQACSDFVQLQEREPQILYGLLWLYRYKVCRVVSSEPPNLRNHATDVLLVKQYVLRRELYYDRVRREVGALESMQDLETSPREPIPESVRLFVWQRDKGQCVKCGARQRLEFDHIIPVVAGGSSTERNVQLLCEACNRSKGSTI
jgi:5-methylcytosine-specific restriction endonuclease McrA